ncbi:MAG: xanthine dehydrogenase small subunit, partial [Marinovum sp.]|nr:xanthine dehydrogenase small subunit [Marinovum sp.]
FNICVQDGKIASVYIAFGGMAGVPKRAQHVEQAILGLPWSMESLEASKAAWSKDFAPIDDMRASADYRIKTAHNLLIRYFHDLSGAESNVLEVSP